jgi:hypothetical protein
MRDVDLEPGESITRSVRKHWFVIVIELLPFVLLAWLPMLFIPFMHFIATIIPHSGEVATFSISANPFVHVGYGLWLLLLWVMAFNTLTRYYLNQWVITTNRIIAIHQYGYFSREVSSVLLLHVQDAETEVDGIFGTLLGYGQLEVQSAGAEEHFIMDDIANPGGLRDLIMREIANLHAGGFAPAPTPSAATGDV